MTTVPMSDVSCDIGVTVDAGRVPSSQSHALDPVGPRPAPPQPVTVSAVVGCALYRLRPRGGVSALIARPRPRSRPRSEEQTSELQSLMRISYAVFCLKKKKQYQTH